MARGFAKYAASAQLKVWACAILPDHFHLVLARHRLNFETLTIQLKGSASKQLIAEKLHPFAFQPGSAEKLQALPKCFARSQWCVFLNDEKDIRRAIRYVESNPLKENKRPQKWSFVSPYTPE